jgi:hypothetical protein
MRLFQESKTNRKPLMITIVSLIAILLIGYAAFQNAQQSTAQEKLLITQRAIERAVVNCYAIEGFYPDSVRYLEDNYGIIIDHKKFVVLYETVGSNVRPYVQVVQRGNATWLEEVKK